MLKYFYNGHPFTVDAFYCILPHGHDFVLLFEEKFNHAENTYEDTKKRGQKMTAHVMTEDMACPERFELPTF
jgi:hypothetical protein